MKAGLGSMLILRALLGISEAAFVGIPFYLSFFFRREELAFRTGLFISAAPLATSFAGVLAWAITKAGEHSPIAPWRLLFLVEGSPSLIVAVIAWHQIPDSPGTVRYFNRRETKVARMRLRGEPAATSRGLTGSGINFQEIGQTLVDPKSYLTAVR